MSADDLKAFFSRLETDSDLQEKSRALQSHSDAGRVKGLCDLAAACGLAVTAEDLSSAAAVPASGELDDRTLAAVVGGVCDDVGALSRTSNFLA